MSPASEFGSAFGPRKPRPRLPMAGFATPVPAFAPPPMTSPFARVWVDEIIHAGRRSGEVLERLIDQMRDKGPDAENDAMAAEVLLGLRAFVRYVEAVKATAA